MAKSKNIIKSFTKQHDLNKLLTFLAPVYLIVIFIALSVVFTSELKRVVEFNRDKYEARLIEVIVESCDISTGKRMNNATCKVRDTSYTRKYLGLDPGRFTNDSIEVGSHLMVYEFPDGSLENDLKIEASYFYLVLSFLGIILFVYRLISKKVKVKIVHKKVEIFKIFFARRGGAQR